MRSRRGRMTPATRIESPWLVAYSYGPPVSLKA